MPHFYGYVFQFLTTESYTCGPCLDHRCNAVPAGHIPCRQVACLPFKIKQTRDYFNVLPYAEESNQSLSLKNV